MACSTAHEHDVFHLYFKSFEECIAWVENTEKDQHFSIRITKPDYRMYRCNRDIRQKLRGREYSSRVGSKKSLDCGSCFSIHKTVKCNCTSPEDKKCTTYSTAFIIKGCLKHNHDIDLRFDRISKKKKKSVQEKLAMEVPPRSIVKADFIASIRDVEENDKTEETANCVLNERPLSMGDAHRIKRQSHLRENGLTTNEVTNVLTLLQEEDFHAFCVNTVLEGFECPELLVPKQVNNLGHMFICYASKEMRGKFQKHPYTLGVDGTHGTNSSKYSLVTFLAYGKQYTF